MSDSNRVGSEAATVSNRPYFEKESKIDPDFYQSSWLEVLSIWAVCGLLYVLLFFLFWGQVAFASVYSVSAMATYIALFIFIVFFIFALLIAGGYANKQYELCEFYEEKILEKEFQMKEEEAIRENNTRNNS